MSPRNSLYVILALIFSWVHTALSTTSPAADHFLSTTCSSSAEFSQTTWATSPTTWDTNPTTWPISPTTSWPTDPTTWSTNPTTWSTNPTTWPTNPTTWPTNPTTWPTNPTTTTNPSSTTMHPSSTITTNPTTTSGTPTVTSSTTSTSTGPPVRLGNCPPDSLSTANSGSGLSSVSNMCGFDADSNIYGIGNRLGIYLQWVGSLITYRFIRGETYSIGATNFIFQLSNFVSLLFITSKKSGNGGGTYAIECWIVLLICTGAVFPGLILSPDRKAKKKKREQDRKEQEEKGQEGAELQSDNGTHQTQSRDLLAVASTSNLTRRTISSDQDILIQPRGPLEDPSTSNLNVARQTTSSNQNRLTRRVQPQGPRNLDPNPVKVSTWGEAFQTALSAATQLFAVWFVFKGMDEMFAPVNSRSAFAFANVNIYHRFRTFLQVFFVTTAVLTLVQTGFVIRSFFLSSSERQARRETPILPFNLHIDLGPTVNGLLKAVGSISVMDQIIKGRQGSDAADKTVALINIIVVYLLFGWIIFIILSIELIIPWNHIAGAYSFDSGQWIILVAATCSLVRVLYIWQRLERLPDDDEERQAELRNSLLNSGHKRKEEFIELYHYVGEGVYGAAGAVAGTIQALLTFERPDTQPRRLIDVENNET